MLEEECIKKVLQLKGVQKVSLDMCQFNLKATDHLGEGLVVPVREQLAPPDGLGEELGPGEGLAVQTVAQLLVGGVPDRVWRLRVRAEPRPQTTTHLQTGSGHTRPEPSPGGNRQT